MKYEALRPQRLRAAPFAGRRWGGFWLAFAVSRQAIWPCALVGLPAAGVGAGQLGSVAAAGGLVEPGAGFASQPGAASVVLARAATKEPQSKGAETRALTAAEEHSRLFTESKYPSAAACRTCHPLHYREWAGSPHAYAQISPVANAMAGAIINANNGTPGDFCGRCHNTVGMNLKEPVFIPTADRHPTSREGITCVVCHRLQVAYGKNSARFALVQGDLLQTIYGPTGDAELRNVLSQPDKYRVVTNRNEPGRKIHLNVAKSRQMTENSFCGSCHDVVEANGFRVEETFSQFQNSPAARKGYKCVDCHMGREPGDPHSGYDTAPAAVVGGMPTKPRKHTNHTFVGPDYSIAHPGIFPHNDKAASLATIPEWLTFDYRAGWGTDKFEKNVPKDYKFPLHWNSADDRYDARAILNEQFALLGEVAKQRLTLLRAGYKLGELVVKQADNRGLKFDVQVKNGTDGHDVPTGFVTERVVYLQVTVTDPQGKAVFKSGDLDPNGDVRGITSVYVHNGDLPLDKYLFNLQSTFMIKPVRGAEFAQPLAENFSASPLPFLRPERFSVMLTSGPFGSRTCLRSIEPNGVRWAKYRVKANELTGPGPYSLRIRLLAAMVPMSLIRNIQGVGFDYNMSPREVADTVRRGHVLLYDKTVPLILTGTKSNTNLAAIADAPNINDYPK